MAKKSFAIPCLSCGLSGIDPEVVERAADAHNLVGKIRLSGSQNVRANARVFEPWHEAARRLQSHAHRG